MRTWWVGLGALILCGGGLSSCGGKVRKPDLEEREPVPHDQGDSTDDDSSADQGDSTDDDSSADRGDPDRPDRGNSDDGGVGEEEPDLPVVGQGGSRSDEPDVVAPEDDDCTGGSCLPYPPTFETVQLILASSAPSCAAADCHSQFKHRVHGRLRLSDPELLYEDLTTHVSNKCAGMMVVVPGEPENSALIKIMTEGCDFDGEIIRMPAGCFRTEEENNCLPDVWIDVLREWIRLGAPKD